MSGMTYRRYAIFFCPDAGLGAVGARWLGWDSALGREHVPELEVLTRRPRKYGFHGTIKPPMRLVDGSSEADLLQAVAALCEGMQPVAPIKLTLSRIGGFLALTPADDLPDLAVLASNVVRGLDPFRAAPDEAELARRRKANLSAQEEENLARWGYPYVLSRFRFHMTLTGPVPRGRFDEVLAKAQTHFAAAIAEPVPVTELCLMGEAQDGRFYQIERFKLKG
ncbi:DUF1045 domain-containing protein [Lentibacter algarum]|uniref:DUF1045 domain-containing protein n=1 Tax=Lentibacter algarum TaxID=576131 RepID=UPI001C07A5FA|nr:DUF1045 domain-containing protein [Lentibacter algarum]MBU2981595.1 DUF1045 domain-containing protein [Lentibacter algarum]